MEKDLGKKVGNSLKWSAITEIIAKIIIPVNNMILARLLTPEAFGVVATVNMVVSFVEVFTDAGFQKYLIQHEFKDEQDREESTNVAFITNMLLSLLIWAVIIIFKDGIADMVGNPGLGTVIAIASVQVPIVGLASIQMSLYKRDFDFKTLFYRRIIVALAPLVVSVPLAISGFGYWALIIGNIASQVANAVILTVKSKWKPRLFYSFSKLKEMFSFSFMTLLESIAVWFSTWVDMFILGKYLPDYYLGLYKTSLQMVNSLIQIVISATIPVLFSTLSRLQNDDKAYKTYLFEFQKMVSFLVFPIGTGVMLYRELATSILLGSKWIEAAPMIGIWCLTRSLTVTTAFFCSEIYRSKGKPQVSFGVQILYVALLIPACIFGAKRGIWTLVYLKAATAVAFILLHLLATNIFMKISALGMIKNLGKPILCSALMGCVGLALQQVSDNILWSIVSILICIVVYGLLFYAVSKKEALVIINFCKNYINKNKN